MNDKWVEFVVGSHACSKGFSLYSLVFFPLQKPTLQNSNSILKQWIVRLFVGCASANSYF